MYLTYIKSIIDAVFVLVSYSAFPFITMDTISQIQCVPENQDCPCDSGKLCYTAKIIKRVYLYRLI